MVCDFFFSQSVLTSTMISIVQWNQLLIPCERHAAQNKAGTTKDLERCRAFCLELDEDDLRARLSTSRRNRGGKAKDIETDIKECRAVDDRWLQEAAEAFGVPFKKRIPKGPDVTPWTFET